VHLRIITTTYICSSFPDPTGGHSSFDGPLCMRPWSIRQGPSPFIDICQVNKHLENIAIFRIAMPELRLSAWRLCGKGVPNVIRLQLRQHTKITIGKVQNLRLQRKPDKNTLWI